MPSAQPREGCHNAVSLWRARCRHTPLLLIWTRVRPHRNRFRLGAERSAKRRSLHRVAAVPTPLATRSSDAFQPTGTNMAAKMKPREAVHRRQMVCPITYVRTTCKPILEINALPDTRVVASADVCCEGGHSLSNASPHPIPPHTFLAPPVRVIPFEVI